MSAETQLDARAEAQVVPHPRRLVWKSWDFRTIAEVRPVPTPADRPIDFWQARNRPRTSDYPFTLLELHWDQNNRGEGMMLAHTRIFVDPRTSDLVLENYSYVPAAQSDEATVTLTTSTLDSDASCRARVSSGALP